ncbi:hypothetical protein [Orrella daihaiensis]|uniref:Alkaline shock response membrane anchor protein AmaP n=1 Tax=Orrella daihaiensis TaxID=2782176 RepID=A0ABY4AK40_9BURK|nr:hypothetical protein [Orrella daihaiensis]UOD50559.1 hypothetical protein DHf2319_01050 [Orrella daihaiensis]
MTTKTDIGQLSSLLRRLCLPRWIWRSVVLVLAALAWLWVAKQILIGGSLVSYEGLQSLGTQVVTFLTRINPYLWWAVTIILTLIVLSLARSWLKSSVKAGREVSVSVADVQKLAQGMSPEGVDVLLWVWDKEAGPVTIGDLIAAREQLRRGRVRKLATARAQHQVLLSARDGQTPGSASPDA